MIPSFWTELPKIINEISDEGKARAIVISSTGKHFCAGMDLAVFTGGGLSDGEKLSEVGEMRLLGNQHFTFKRALHVLSERECQSWLQYKVVA